MGDFERDTAVEPIGDGRYRAALDPSWSLWGPAGGYVSAIALRAALAASRFDRPASYACQYLSFARFDAVELDVTTLRAGRRTEALRVEMRQKERPILEAHVWTRGEAEGLEHDHTRMPDAPPAEALRSLSEQTGQARYDQGFFANFERRAAEWPAGDDVTGEPVLASWCRFRPRARGSDPCADAVRAVILLDTYTWPAVYGVHPHREPLPWIAPNLDLHVRFHASAAAHDWLFCEGRAELAAEGVIGTHGSLWTPERELVAFASSQLLCRPRPAES